MKTKRYLKLSCLAASITLTVSCNKLDEYNPSGATADAVWSTPEGFVTNVNAAYSEQRAWYGKEDGIFMSESGTDLWFNRDKNTYAGQLTQYAGLTPLQGNPVRAAWRDLWKAINICNAGINRINDAGFTNQAEKNRREGELRFLRAFYYWHIVETFGGVMLRTEETKTPLLTAQRSPVEDFYNLIISDLEFAVANLPLQSFWGNEYSRASKKSAMGFLARALLSRAYYSTGTDAQTYFTRARDAAKAVIDNKAALEIDLWTSYADMWNPANNKRNKEALYVVSNSTNQAINYDANGNRLYQVFQARYNGKPGLVQSLEYGFENSRRLMPTLSFLDYFNENIDSRYETSFQEVWIANTNFTWTASLAAANRKDPSVIGKVIRAGIDTALYITKKVVPNDRLKPYIVIDRDSVYNTNGTIITGADHINFKKFRDPDRTAANAQPGFKDVIVMRLAEMYLIAAEAEWKLNNPGAAADYINVLRTRAAKKTPVNQTAAMQVSAANINEDFILKERARELAGEHLRWFDLKRMLGANNGQAFVDFIKAQNPDITQVQPFHRLRPIRQEELNALLNAEEFGQNPGYD
ncbi:RagB/SusD family nutrient uptake outer membrane protein [Pedobacter glucosidilyticus]|uniref:RagB/SusD family nutrient uptake outer membrane protein n=1 Tax=Pedobacter glucosidilyticus TaxID=1122941 RepID=UPI0026E97E9B|nr:RagB/SusD family nutrient uptake outer membrane protein [Pedobacter glucosidilyticus]